MSELKDITNLEAERDSGIGSLKNIIPPNIRMFVQDLFGGKEPFTEQDLTGSNKTLLKDSIDKPLLENMMNDRYNLKTLLGKAKVELNKQGELVVKDTFDFNDKKDIKNLEDFKFALKDMADAYQGTSGAGKGGLYSLIRQGAKYLGSGPGEGIPVEINLGKYKNI